MGETPPFFVSSILKMATLDHLKNLPTEPGDVVRSRKTNKEYVVQEATALAAGGAFLYHLIDVVDGKIESHSGGSLEDINYYYVRRNVEKLTPNDVIRERLEHFRSVLRGNQEIISKLDSAEGGVYKDILLLLRDADDDTLKEKFLKFTNNLTMKSTGTYTEQEVVDMLTEMLGGNASAYSKEHIHAVASDLMGVITKGPKLDSLTTPSIVSPSVASRTSTGRAIKPFFNTYEDEKYARWMQRNLFSRNSLNFDNEDISRILNSGLSHKAKVTAIVKQITRSPNVDNTVIGHLMSGDKALEAALSIVRKDKSNLRLSFLQSSDAPTQKRGAIKYSPAYQSYNRRTAAQSRWRNQPTKRVNVSSLLGAERLPSGEARVFAFTPEALLNDVLKGKNVTLDGKMIAANDIRLKAYFKENTGPVLVEARKLRDMANSNGIELRDVFTGAAEIRAKVGGDFYDDINAKLGLSTSTRPRTPVLEFGMTERRSISGSSEIGQSSLLRSLNASGEVAYFNATQFEEAHRHAGASGYVTAAEYKEAIPDDLSSQDFTRKIRSLANSGELQFKPVAQQTTQVITTEAVETGELAAAYERTSSQARMGYAMISDATGKKAVRLVGSEFDGDVYTHLQRGLAAQTDDNSMILDIESSIIDRASGNHRIGQIGLGNRAGTIMDFRSSDGSVESEISAIQELLGHMRGSNYVGTQGKHDFDTLISRVQNLSEDLEAVEHHDVLQNMEQELRHIRANKGYDIIPLYHAAGEEVGRASQGYLAAKYLGEEHLHTAAMDVAQAYRLGDKLSLSSLKFIGGVAPEDTHGGGAVFYAHDARTGLSGSFLHLKGFNNTGVGNPGVEAIFQHMALGKDGSFTPTGGLVALRGDSANMVGGGIRGMNVVGTAEGLFDKSKVGELMNAQASRVEDRFGRYARGLNPFTKTFNDVTDSFTREVALKSGTFGGSELLVLKEARRILNSQAGRNLLGEKKSAKELLSLNTSTFHDADVSRSFNERLLYHLEEAVHNPVHMAMFDDGGGLSRLLNSSFGQEFTNLTRSGMNGAEGDLYRASMLAQYSIDKVLRTEGTAPLITDTPRLSISAFANSKAFGGAVSLNVGPDMAFGDVDNALKNISSQIIVSLNNKNHSDEAENILMSAGIDASTIHKVRQAVSERLGDAEATHNIPNLNQTLQEMHHLDRLGSHAVIPETLETLMNSDALKDMVKNSVKHRGDSFQRTSGLLGVSNAPEVHSNISSILDEMFVGNRNASEALSAFFNKAYEKMEPETDKYFTHVYENFVDFTRLGSLDEETVGNIVQGLHSATQIDTEQGGSSILGKILSHAHEIRAAGYEAQLPPQDIIHHTTAFIKESVDAVHTEPSDGLISKLLKISSEYQTRMAEIGSADMSTMEAQSKIVHQAMGAVAGAAESEWAATTALQHAEQLGAKIGGVSGFKKVIGPLMAVGGVLALLASVKHPKEEYSGGAASEKTTGVIGAMSEIPGNPAGSKVYVGGTEPFKIKVNAKAYIQNERDRRNLEYAIYQRVSGITGPGAFSKKEHRDKTVSGDVLAYKELMDNA